MNDSGVYRKVDELGRIVIPKEIRRDFGIQYKDRVYLSADRFSRTILLKCMGRVCLRCGSEKNLRNVRDDLFLCSDCLEVL